MWAFLNDVFQRVVTLNKLEQRIFLKREVAACGIQPGQAVLDFGCGTGLFAPVFKEQNYTGYDVDKKFLKYAAFLYPFGHFTDSYDEVRQSPPYKMVLANCCFHHIDDTTLHTLLNCIREVLSPGGVFLLIDLIKPTGKVNFLRKLYSKLEQGDHLRQHEEYVKLAEQHFTIGKILQCKSHVLSLPGPVYSELVVLRCFKKE